jgi:hypothetical protein
MGMATTKPAGIKIKIVVRKIELRIFIEHCYVAVMYSFCT